MYKVHDHIRYNSNSISQLSLKKMSDILIEQFEGLPKDPHPDNFYTHAKQNHHKNNFSDILPGKNRVMLDLLVNNYGKVLANSDYINANYINDAYIITQQPDNTKGDFWRMVMEQKVNMVINFTNKCDYCNTMNYSFVKVELMKTVQHDNMNIYTMKVQGISDYAKYQIINSSLKSSIDSDSEIINEETAKLSKKEPMPTTVDVFHFLDWVDHSTPDPEKFRKFYHMIKRHETILKLFGNTNGIKMFHCRAGIGRSMVGILIDYMLKKYKTEADINNNIINTIRNMRECRAKSIETTKQFQFAYDFIINEIRNRKSDDVKRPKKKNKLSCSSDGYVAESSDDRHCLTRSIY